MKLTIQMFQKNKDKAKSYKTNPSLISKKKWEEMKNFVPSLMGTCRAWSFNRLRMIETEMRNY